MVWYGVGRSYLHYEKRHIGWEVRNEQLDERGCCYAYAHVQMRQRVQMYTTNSGTKGAIMRYIIRKKD